MTSLKWWQTAVFYQIYPRSFADGNGDGIGDFIGMIERLDYLADLGVDALWLSPHFPSPQFDVGYDISDYIDVAPEYGTLDDFKQFLDGAHERGMRVILDLVMNHTSHLHQWFIESRPAASTPNAIGTSGAMAREEVLPTTGIHLLAVQHGNTMKRQINIIITSSSKNSLT